MQQCSGYRERKVISKIFGEQYKCLCYCSGKETICKGDKTKCMYFPQIKEKAERDLMNTQ